jgi:hypothetical protein
MYTSSSKSENQSKLTSILYTIVVQNAWQQASNFMACVGKLLKGEFNRRFRTNESGRPCLSNDQISISRAKVYKRMPHKPQTKE